ncbi:MAG: hemerythrin domain-containing protein [Candidatus Aenigmarchaeota archaeon]|nr:hemerythrin domain-containing protein [Candidatus Aenigmarchaeota archaeon]
MQRIRPYDVPHKGLRNVMSQFSLLAGNVSFNDSQQVDHLHKIGTDMFTFLKQHANDENTIVLPEFEKKEPAVGEHIRIEHHKIDEAQQKVETLLNEIHSKSQNSQDIRDLGARLYDSYHNFHSQYLLHMVDEEQNIQPLLWKHFTDEELLAFSKRILGSMKPEILLMVFRYVAPAQSHSERVMVLKGMKMGAPPQFFEKLMETVKSVLIEEDYEKLEKELQ